MNYQENSNSPTEPPTQSNSLAEEPPLPGEAEALPQCHCSTAIFFNGAAFPDSFIKAKISGGNDERIF